MAQKSNLIANPVFWLIFSLTLGLMPYSPEPHIWEKLKWIFTGAQGMKPLDWFDFVLHGTPWGFMTISLVQKLIPRVN